MYLANLAIHGFKSFAKKTSFEFNDGITCIVGPNGCGKSNIVDAIRWVLGEQRAGLIRSDRMENVIFNGTQSMKPLGMAEVSLTIHNTKNVLPIEYTEVVITRRLFRSSESQYLLNNSPCRLKDIQGLFMDTGMGPDAYSIIELSMVETILNGKAEERRRIIEEAAGVTKYKLRRKAAFRKLEATEADLTRVNDIISEVEKNVASLQRQVRKAQRYQEYKDTLQEKEIRLATYQFSKLKEELQPLTETLNSAQDRRVELSSHLDEKEAELEKARTEQLSVERELSAKQRELNELGAKIQGKEEEILVARERCKALEDTKTRMQRDQGEIDLKLQRNKEQISGSKDSLQDLFERIQIAENDFQEKNAELKGLELRLHEKNEEVKAIERQRLQAAEGLTESKQEEERIRTQLENIEHRITALEAEMEENELLETVRKEKIEALDEQKQSASARLEEHKKRHDDIQTQLKKLSEEKEETRERILNRRSEVQTLKERIELLRKFIESYEDHPEGVQHILLHGHLNGGCKGTLGDNLTVKSQYRRAVETAMGDASVSLIVEATDQALECIEMLKANEKGSVTFFPLDRFTNGHQNGGDKFDRDLLQAEGVVDWAYNLVDCSAAYRPLVRSLLDEYLVVENLSVARKHAERLRDKHINFITLHGEIVSTWGPIRGGENGDGYAGIIGRKALVEELQSELKSLFEQLDRDESEAQNIDHRQQETREKASTLTAQIDELEEEIREVEVQLAQLNYESKKSTEAQDKLRKEIDAQKTMRKDLQQRLQEIAPSLDDMVANKSQFESSLNRISEELQQIEAQVEEQRAITQDSRVQLVDLKSEERHLQENISRLYEYEKELQASLVRMQEEIESATTESAELNKQIEVNKNLIQEDFDKHKEMQEKVEQLEQKYFDGKEEVEGKEKAIRGLRREKDTASDELHDLDMRVSELKSRCQSIRERIKEEYKVEIQQEPLPEDFDSEAFSEEISEIEKKLDAMGPVNLLALKEYEKEKERLDFLLGQKNDLNEAEQNLNETIQVINKTAREQFHDIFKQIQENFATVFSSFFPNGQARLKLDADDDPLESDIVIEADPKGKRISALSLLSGGEKTLTAISLLFAIYLVKPSPFCILDEVDAPLDDANIGRFVKAIREFSNNTQFIIVTHNKLTMRASDCLYGVTMEEPGVSKVVSVNFKDMDVA